jgi:hypothetical protein
MSSVLARHANEALTQRLAQTNMKTLLLSDTRATLSSIQEFQDDSALFEAIEDAGWTVLHTWDGA